MPPPPCGSPRLKREITTLEREVLARHDAAEKLIAGLADDLDPTKAYVPSMLQVTER